MLRLASTPPPARRSLQVDIAGVLGIGTRVPARVIDVARGQAGARHLERPAILVEGVVLRSVTLGVRTSAMLYGPGDVLPGAGEEPEPFAATARALRPSRIAPLDPELVSRIASIPALADAVASGADGKLDRFMLQAVLVQLTSIRERLEVLLPQLSERWGTVTADGVMLPAFFSHTVLAALVGVRRPSLTTALGELAANGDMVRLEDRRWRITRELAGL